jgi:hypothetical protein
MDVLLDPAFVDGLRDLPLAEIRDRRRQCSEVEVGLSYFRRLVQGRLDIVLAEAHRRETGAEPEDIAALVERLPEILGDNVHSSGNGRLPSLMSPSEADRARADQLDAVVDVDRIAALPLLTEDDLRATVDALSTLEREASKSRRALHAVMDRLQEELVRRYRSGEATVDSLLH